MVLSMAQMGNDGTLWSIDKQAGVAQCYVGAGRWEANTNRKIKWISCASAIGGQAAQGSDLQPASRQRRATHALPNGALLEGGAARG